MPAVSSSNSSSSLRAPDQPRVEGPGVAAARRRKRRGPKHPGVTLVRPNPARRIGWRARFVDPDTGRTVWKALDPSLTTEEARAAWAVRKSKALAQRRLELEGGAPRATGTALGAALDRYYRDHPALAETTRAIYKRATDKLATWAARVGLESADDLNGPRLVAFRAELVKEPLRKSAKGAKRGARQETPKLRSAESVNRDLSRGEHGAHLLAPAWLAPSPHGRRAERLPRSAEDGSEADRLSQAA